jgi:hypothetical protein
MYTKDNQVPIKSFNRVKDDAAMHENASLARRRRSQAILHRGSTNRSSLRLKGSFGKLLVEKENTVNQAHVNPATRHNTRLSLSLSLSFSLDLARARERSVSRGAHFYLFHPVTRVAHSNTYAPTRHPGPAAPRIVESLRNLHASRSPPWILKRYRHTCAVCASRWIDPIVNR